MATKKYLSLESLTEYDALLKAEISKGDAAALKSAKDYADGLVSGGHNHDDRYYTETEIDNKLSEVNTSITNITSGTTVVKNAEHAVNADNATHATTATTAGSANTANSATKATQDASGNVITETYETKTDATAKLTKAKDYTDEKIALLLNNSSEAVDSIMELADAMKDNADTIEALTDIASGKADAEHKHEIADVNGLQDALNSKASKTDFDAHIASTNIQHITDVERTNWNAAKTHADSAHAPSNAQANVIESIKVNGTAQTISGKSVDITVPTDNSQLANGAGYITSSAITNKADKATTLAGYGITNAYTKTEVDTIANGKATTTALNNHINNADVHFTTTERTKLSNIEAGANKTVVDTALSSTSTNPVQNKVINTALASAAEAILANTSSINAHTGRIEALETKVGDGFEEITSQDIQNLFK